MSLRKQFSKKAPLVSVIIPVYNAERFIGKCLDSLIVQDTPDYELIFINDCSTDSSAKIIEKALEFENHITLVHMPFNSGASAARNMGLQRARGKYIMFCDADDVAHTQFVSKMSAVMEKHKVDCAMCELDLEAEEGTSPHRTAAEAAYLDQCFKNDYYSLDEAVLGVANHVLYNKIFRRRIIEKYKIRFNELLRTSEDIDFVLRYLLVAKDIYMIHEQLYRHTIRVQSLAGEDERRDIAFYNRDMSTLWDAYEFMKKHGVHKNKKRVETLKQLIVGKMYFFGDVIHRDVANSIGGAMRATGESVGGKTVG